MFALIKTINEVPKKIEKLGTFQEVQNERAKRLPKSGPTTDYLIYREDMIPRELTEQSSKKSTTQRGQNNNPFPNHPSPRGGTSIG